MKTNNPVNHPGHYTQGGIECIAAADLIESPQAKLADARNELCHAGGGNL